MGLFDQGRKLADETGDDEHIEYMRDVLSVGEVCAKVGQSVLYTQEYGGVTMHVHRMDFIVRAQDLKIARPAVRDIIVWEGKRYAVCDTDADKCWRWHDRKQTTYRIHAEEVEREQVD